jgi:hypothetical protein
MSNSCPPSIPMGRSQRGARLAFRISIRVILYLSSCAVAIQPPTALRGRTAASAIVPPPGRVILQAEARPELLIRDGMRIAEGGSERLVVQIVRTNRRPSDFAYWHLAEVGTEQTYCPQTGRNRT